MIARPAVVRPPPPQEQDNERPSSPPCTAANLPLSFIVRRGQLGYGEHERVMQRGRVYRYRLIDKPDTWLAMIAPGGDLQEANAVA